MQPSCFEADHQQFEVSVFISNLTKDLAWFAGRQGMTLKTATELRKEARRPWNASSAVPIIEWLHHKQSEQDVARLKACGNVVIPQCAAAALHVLGNHEVNPTTN